MMLPQTTLCAYVIILRCQFVDETSENEHSLSEALARDFTFPD